MKISKSKKELARIISENGGWREGAEWAAQDKCAQVTLFKSKPVRHGNTWLDCNGMDDVDGFGCDKAKNWHQAILSREEYFHLYPAPDADGWIEWKGGECPVDGGAMVVCKVRTGKLWRNGKAIAAGVLRWSDTDSTTDIIAYCLHNPEQAKPRFCESVMRSIPECEIHSKNMDITQVDDIDVVELKTTIEQLAAEYRNAKNYAERKQEEADAAKAYADAKLAELVAAGKAIGLVLSVVAPEPELVITDWRDLRVGDYVEARCHAGVLIGFITEMEPKDYDGERPFSFQPLGESTRWCTSSKFKFIRRP